MRATGTSALTLSACVLFAFIELASVPGTLGAQTMDRAIYTFVLGERMEFAPGVEGDPIEYEVGGWIGGDVQRLWFDVEGEHATRSRGEREVELQIMYGRLVFPFWDLQLGGRLDRDYGHESGATRFLAVVALNGLAPYWFHVGSALFLSDDGDLSARVEASYDLLLSQRMILEPEFELNLSATDVPEFGIGSGLTDIELGARLRYEFKRELAPYVGYDWSRRLGNTADLARDEGEKVGDGSFVFGARWWW